MFNILNNEFMSMSIYTTQLVLPGLSFLPLVLYFTTIIWLISIILNNSMSTRINTQQMSYRTGVKNQLIKLYQV